MFHPSFIIFSKYLKNKYNPCHYIVHEKVTSVLHELGRYFYSNTVRLLVENWTRVLNFLITFPSYLNSLLYKQMEVLEDELPRYV